MKSKKVRLLILIAAIIAFILLGLMFVTDIPNYILLISALVVLEISFIIGLITCAKERQKKEE